MGDTVIMYPVDPEHFSGLSIAGVPCKESGGGYEVPLEAIEEAKGHGLTTERPAKLGAPKAAAKVVEKVAEKVGGLFSRGEEKEAETVPAAKHEPKHETESLGESIMPEPRKRGR